MGDSEKMSSKSPQTSVRKPFLQFIFFPLQLLRGIQRWQKVFVTMRDLEAEIDKAMPCASQQEHLQLAPLPTRYPYLEIHIFITTDCRGKKHFNVLANNPWFWRSARASSGYVSNSHATHGTDCNPTAECNAMPCQIKFCYTVA